MNNRAHMVFLEGRYGDAEKPERDARVNSMPIRSLTPRIWNRMEPHWSRAICRECATKNLWGLTGSKSASSHQPALSHQRGPPFVRTTLSALSVAAFPNVSYAFMMSFIAKR